jgi:hypothetical protein
MYVGVIVNRERETKYWQCISKYRDRRKCVSRDTRGWYWVLPQL